jgi:hypothetical protein
MCCCIPALKGAEAAGDVVRVVELLLEPCPRSSCPPSRRVERLNDFSKNHTHSRALVHADALRRGIAALYVEACELVPETVERLWRSEGEVGVAWFPVVTEDGTDGRVYALRAELRGDGSERGRAEAHDQASDQGSEQRLDASFREAIEAARVFTLRRFAHGPSVRRVGAARVRVLASPDARLTDGSVALAAFVAFASIALGATVRASRAFSGVLVDGDFVFPHAGTIPAKLAATAHHGQFKHLVCPSTRKPDVLPAAGHESLLLTCNWQGVLAEAFNRSFPELEAEISAELPLPLGPGSSIELVSPADDAREERLLSLIVAAGAWGLAPYDLERAIELPGVWPERVSFAGGHVERICRRLEATGQIRSRDQVLVAAAPGRGSTRQLELAHQALARLRAAQGELAGQATHLVALGQWHQAAGCVTAALAQGGIPAAAGVIGQLVQQGKPGLPGPFCEAIRGLKPPSLLALSLCWSSLPGPFTALCVRLSRCIDPLDRLFLLQAAAELLLHMLAAAVLSAGRVAGPSGEPSGDVLEPDYLLRPSLGILLKAAMRLRRAPRDAGAGAGAADLATVLQPVARQVPPRLDAVLNQLIHHHGGWLELRDLPEKQVDAEIEKLAASLLPAFDALARLHPSLRAGDAAGAAELVAGGVALPLGAHVALTDGGALFYRGLIDGVVRYWAFDEPSVFHAAAPWDAGSDVFSSKAPPPVRRAVPTHFPLPARRALPINDLPQPIARSMVASRVADGGVAQLACLDAAFGALLRLAVAAELQGLPAAVSVVRRGMVTKRHLLDVLTAPAGLSTSSLGRYLRDGGGREGAASLLDMLERLEHAPGPVSAWSQLVERARSLLTDLLLGSPFVVDPSCRLVGVGEASPQRCVLHGLEARPHRQPAPDPPPGHVLLVDGAKAIALHPWACALGGGGKGGLELQLFDRGRERPDGWHAVRQDAQGLSIARRPRADER